MYVYNTITDNCSLPKDGWLFPCIHCRSITNFSIKKRLDNNIFFGKFIIIPMCRNCITKNLNLPILYKEKYYQPKL